MKKRDLVFGFMMICISAFLASIVFFELFALMVVIYVWHLK